MLRVLLLSLFSIVIVSCSNDVERLEKIKAQGEIVVLTRNAATSLYESREGKLGLEHDMVQAFAEYLGVKARFIIKEDVSSLLESINNKEADFIAAGITKTTERDDAYLFGPTYMNVAQQIVCRRGGKRPKKIEDIKGISLHVSEKSSYVETLNKIKIQQPEIQWKEIEDTDTETLLERVWQKKIDCTVADSNIVSINRRYMPELSVRFNLTEPEPLAWLIPKDDSGLKYLVESWYDDFEASGQLNEVIHRYYGFIERFDYVDTRALQRKIKTDLPTYKKAFKQAAKKHKLNWTLIAAQAYQESHWRANAKSPTGVRGLMMLTRTTAKELGIKNRLDPVASINGGAYYLNKLRKRLPKNITEPDRTWLALAAYNVGMGHIWDARKLAKEMGKNPDSWQELATVLPLLSNKKYYKNLKYGYARGAEPVKYVKNIRNYQDIIEKRLNQNSL
ncbi:MAG: membrane-bound lytic murein transglycosylase MltF [Woeseiaceae bacterium]